MLWGTSRRPSASLDGCLFGMPRRPDVHSLATAAAAPHPLFKRFDRPMCWILVHIHIGTVVAVEAINCNRIDTILSHVGEVH